MIVSNFPSLRRVFSLIGCWAGMAFALSSCASVGPTLSKKTDDKHAKQLSVQTLPPGNCGMFFWSIEKRPRFVFFHDISKSEAVFYHQGRTKKLAFDFAQNPRTILKEFELRYILPASALNIDGLEIILKGKLPAHVQLGTPHKILPPISTLAGDLVDGYKIEPAHLIWKDIAKDPINTNKPEQAWQIRKPLTGVYACQPKQYASPNSNQGRTIIN